MHTNDNDIYFRGSLDELLSIEDHLCDSNTAYYRVWGRHASGTSFQSDYTNDEKDSVLNDFTWFNDHYKIGEENINKKLEVFFASADKDFSICWKEHEDLYMAVEKIRKDEYVSPKAWADMISNDEDGIFVSS